MRSSDPLGIISEDKVNYTLFLQLAMAAAVYGLTETYIMVIDTNCIWIKG